MKDKEKMKENELHISVVFKCLNDNKFKLLLITAIILIVSTIYAYNLPNVYQSDATLAPSNDESNSKIGSGLGSIAALAGVSLNNSKMDKTGIALETMKSRSFIIDFIKDNDLYAKIFAIKEIKNGEVVIDERKYNYSQKEWMLDENGRTKKPTDLESYNEFKKLFSIEQEKTSGLIKLYMRHQSPDLARKWLELIVVSINNKIREQDIDSARKNIKFLEAKLTDTANAEMKDVLYSLIQEQMKTIMLASAREEYVFRTIDKPVAAEEHIKPARLAIILFITFLGLVAGTIVILVKSLDKYRG